MTASKLRNIGPKSAAWLRQVGLRTTEDIAAVGAVEAFLRIKRAGFRPSLNLLYSLEGALTDRHWQEIPQERRETLVAELEAGLALLPNPRGTPVAGPVATTSFEDPDRRGGEDDGGGQDPGFGGLDSHGDEPGGGGGGEDEHA